MRADDAVHETRIARRAAIGRGHLHVSAGCVHVPLPHQPARLRRRRSAHSGAQALEGAHGSAAVLRQDDSAALEGIVGAKMRLTSTAFADGGRIPADLAFCAIDPATHVKLSENMNPDLRWSDVPAGTKSLALIRHAPDVPPLGDG